MKTAPSERKALDPVTLEAVLDLRREEYPAFVTTHNAGHFDQLPQLIRQRISEARRQGVKGTQYAFEVWAYLNERYNHVHLNAPILELPDIAKELGFSQSTASRAIRVLKDLELLSSEVSRYSSKSEPKTQGARYTPLPIVVTGKQAFRAMPAIISPEDTPTATETVIEANYLTNATSVKSNPPRPKTAEPQITGDNVTPLLMPPVAPVIYREFFTDSSTERKTDRSKKATAKQLQLIEKQMLDNGLSGAECWTALYSRLGVSIREEMTVAQADDTIKALWRGSPLAVAIASDRHEQRTKEQTIERKRKEDAEALETKPSQEQTRKYASELKQIMAQGLATTKRRS